MKEYKNRTATFITDLNNFTQQFKFYFVKIQNVNRKSKFYINNQNV